MSNEAKTFKEMKELLTTIGEDVTWIDEYISICSVGKFGGNIWYERNHILPRSLFPEYEYSYWNIVILPYEIHKRVHELLAKSGNLLMIYASALMNRTPLNGELNPAKRKEVREKISSSKLGVHRFDMKGKAYFGASKETINNIKRKQSDTLKNSVVVKDKDGNKFRVSIDDERYINGELVPHNLGNKLTTYAFSDKKLVNRIISNRENSYREIAKDLDTLVNHIVDAHKRGKKVFSKRGFSSNYSRIVKLSSFTKEDVLAHVVQRLSNETDLTVS